MLVFALHKTLSMPDQRVSQAVVLAQRCRRTLRSVLKELKRSVFASRAARELYGLDDSLLSPVPDAPSRNAPSSITRPRWVAVCHAVSCYTSNESKQPALIVFDDRLNSMAMKIQEGRRVMRTLDQSISTVDSEVRSGGQLKHSFLDSWLAMARHA